jgi:hypothetical protein
MTPLRDALATALGRTIIDPDHEPDCESCHVNADAILYDPAFRLALTESIAEALGADPGWFPMKTREDDAAAIVARMLGEPT